jgi:hypothetical protein
MASLLDARLSALEYTLVPAPSGTSPESLLHRVQSLVKQLQAVQDRSCVEFFDKYRLCESLLDASDSTLEHARLHTKAQQDFVLSAADELEHQQHQLETLTALIPMLDRDTKHLVAVASSTTALSQLEQTTARLASAIEQHHANLDALMTANFNVVDDTSTALVHWATTLSAWEAQLDLKTQSGAAERDDSATTNKAAV